MWGLCHIIKTKEQHIERHRLLGGLGSILCIQEGEHAYIVWGEFFSEEAILFFKK